MVQIDTASWASIIGVVSGAVIIAAKIIHDKYVKVVVLLKEARDVIEMTKKLLNKKNITKKDRNKLQKEIDEFLEALKEI